jgi:catechol 2,3-dioxygenase-like lactoylglutathione lyase family enzyme
MLIDIAIPILPARDLDQSVEFYLRLGFQLVGRAPAPEDYALLRRDGMELHLYGAPELDPATCYAACYLRVTDAKQLHGEYAKLNLPDTGMPRLSALEEKPWGMREFHVVDPSGVLLRIGDFNTDAER